MNTTEISKIAYAVVKENSDDIKLDLARVTDGRRFRPSLLRSITLPSLNVVVDPYFLLANRHGEYIVGDITSTHGSLLDYWNNQRKKKRQPQISRTEVTLVSGIGFGLRINPNFKYIRLDVVSNRWNELPSYAITLMDAGYYILDACLERVAKDVDYTHNPLSIDI